MSDVTDGADLNLLVSQFVELVRAEVCDEPSVHLWRSSFGALERDAVLACLDAGVVSSVGPQVGEFEERVAGFLGAGHGVAMVNGTNALQIALQLVGVERDCEVLTQALTFVATCNAISYVGARPVFLDVERSTLGMDPQALANFLDAFGERREDGCYNRQTGRRIAACMPMHTLGHPSRIDEIAEICAAWDIPLVEDAAESFGSYYKGRHAGTFGRLGVFSFNGNKIITTGGGGMIVTHDAELAARARHLTTTAKVPHAYEYVHDEIGYNLRMPNLNAALGCAQMERLPDYLAAKRKLAQRYAAFFNEHGIEFITEPENARSNYWLNGIVLEKRAERDAFLKATHQRGILTRPIWRLMTELPMFASCQHDGLEVSRWLVDRVVNLPSGPKG